MPIPESHVKERLSVAYLTAVAARAGVACHFPGGTEYGTDALINAVVELPGGKLNDTGVILPVQLKATTAWEHKNGLIVYEMEVPAYNKIVTRGGTPCILILLCLPAEQNEWLYHDDQQFLLKKCCYWERLCGQPSTNSRTKTIHIKDDQLLTTGALLDLLTRADEGKL